MKIKDVLEKKCYKVLKTYALYTAQVEMLTTTEAEKLQNDIARMILSVLNQNHLLERLT